MNILNHTEQGGEREGKTSSVPSAKSRVNMGRKEVIHRGWTEEQDPTCSFNPYTKSQEEMKK